MAALAYGGLDSVVRTRAELEARQAQFQALRRSVNLLERDLRQCAVRPVRDNDGAALPAFVGAPDRVELTRLGFANPQAEARSNLERVGYAFADDALVRAAWPVLDRAPGTEPSKRVLRRPIRELRLRYLDAGNRWTDAWPPPTADADTPPAPLPRAVEFRIATDDYGEISRIVELPSPWPETAGESAGAGP